MLLSVFPWAASGRSSWLRRQRCEKTRAHRRRVCSKAGHMHSGGFCARPPCDVRWGKAGRLSWSRLGWGNHAATVSAHTWLFAGIHCCFFCGVRARRGRCASIGPTHRGRRASFLRMIACPPQPGRRTYDGLSPPPSGETSPVILFRGRLSQLVSGRMSLRCLEWLPGGPTHVAVCHA